MKITAIQHESGNILIEAIDKDPRRFKIQSVLTPQETLTLRDKLTEILRLINYISKPASQQAIVPASSEQQASRLASSEHLARRHAMTWD
jgi:hypothetical protein